MLRLLLNALVAVDTSVRVAALSRDLFQQQSDRFLLGSAWIHPYNRLLWKVRSCCSSHPSWELCSSSSPTPANSSAGWTRAVPRTTFSTVSGPRFSPTLHSFCSESDSSFWRLPGR